MLFAQNKKIISTIFKISGTLVTLLYVPLRSNSDEYTYVAGTIISFNNKAERPFHLFKGSVK
jgi:hypothetical protein